MGERRRRVELRLEGDGIGSGRAPLPLLNTLFKDIQDALYVVGRYELDQSGWSVGRIPTPVLKTCRLDLVGLKRGSLVPVLELPPTPSVTQRSLSILDDYDEQDIGELSIHRFGEFVQALSVGDMKRTQRLMPDLGSRSKLVHLIRDLARPSNQGTAVALAIGEFEPIQIDRTLSDRALAMVYEPIEGPAVLVGRMVMAEVEPSRYFMISRGGKRIKCHYGEDLDDIVASAFDTLVEVSGRAELGDNEEVREIVQVEDLDRIDLAPFQLRTLTTHRRAFRLNPAIPFDLTYENGLLIAENEDLGLVSVGTSRAALLDDVAMDFDVMWEDFAEAPAKDLTGDAIDLGNKVRSLVASVEEDSDEADQDAGS